MDFDFVPDSNDPVLVEFAKQGDCVIKDMVAKNDIKGMENILSQVSSTNNYLQWDSMILLRLCCIGTIRINLGDPEIAIKTELKNRARILINKYFDMYFA